MVAAALDYLARGWCVIPVCPKTKLPHSRLLPKDRAGEPSWKLLTLRPATTREVLHWREEDPEFNVGIALGECSSYLVVVDVDRTPDRPLHLPPTVTAVTGRGAHYYYIAQNPVPTIKCAWGEIRSEGAYVVAPPSTHPSGAVYQWADFCAPGEIELAELPADLLQAAENDRDRLQQSRGQVSKKNYSFTRLPCPESSPRILDDWFRSEEAAVRILRACGVANPKVGKGIPCCLPGHHEKHPSAALWRQPDGAYGWHDFHQRDGREWFSLAEVYASVKAGKTMKLGPGETAAWMLRAVMDVGLLKAPAVMAPKVPADAPEVVRDVYAGFLKLLAVRAIYNAAQTSAPYSWRFAALWCGRSERHTGEAIKWLLQRGYLRPADEPGDRSKRKATLLALGTPKEANSR